MAKSKQPRKQSKPAAKAKAQHVTGQAKNVPTAPSPVTAEPPAVLPIAVSDTAADTATPVEVTVASPNDAAQPDDAAQPEAVAPIEEPLQTIAPAEDLPAEAPPDEVPSPATLPPETEAPLETPPPARPAPPSQPERQGQQPAGVSIQINIPAFKLPAAKTARKLYQVTRPVIGRVRPYLTKKRVLTASAALAGLLAIVLLAHAISVHHRQQLAAQAVNAGRQKEAKPTFKPIVPATQPDLAVPDGMHSRFDSSHGSYSFFDKIGSEQFTVSEQQFASSVAAESAVGRAAQSLNATHQLPTKWGAAYVVTVQKYGSQEIVFNANDLLCFIQSANILSDDKWVAYINSLR